MNGHKTVYAIGLKSERLRHEAIKPEIECLFYGDLENETPEQFLLRQEEATLLYRAIDRLHPRYARAVRCKYGLGCEPMTLDQVGEQFNVTKERARQMVCKGERVMLRYLKNDFRERFLSKAKRYNWWWELERIKLAKEKVQEAEWKAQREAREAKRREQERIMVEREREALEAKRIKEENERRQPSPHRFYSSHRFYQPRLVDPATGAWEWVLVQG